MFMRETNRVVDIMKLTVSIPGLLLVDDEGQFLPLLVTDNSGISGAVLSQHGVYAFSS